MNTTNKLMQFIQGRFNQKLNAEIAPQTIRIVESEMDSALRELRNTASRQSAELEFLELRIERIEKNLKRSKKKGSKKK
jgi:hypothetical protein